MSLPSGDSEATVGLLLCRRSCQLSESVVPFPLNGSPVGLSVPWRNVTSGSEELYLDEPVGAGVVSASISGYVELGIERGAILPTTTTCPVRVK